MKTEQKNKFPIGAILLMALLIVCCGIVFVACENVNNSASTQRSSLARATVYSVREESGGAGGKPCYWQDFDEKELLLPPGIEGAYINSITVSDGIVYSAGTCYDGTRSYPYLWIGTTPVRLEDPSPVDTQAFPIAIAVENGTVYIAGIDFATGGDRAFYWTGTKLTFLEPPEGSALYHVQRMAVENGTVYFCGYYRKGGNYYPCYWTGTKPTPVEVPEGVVGAHICGITVVNGTAHLGGYYTVGASPNYVLHACYWIGSEITPILIPTGAPNSTSCINGIGAADGTVYMTGYYTSDMEANNQRAFYMTEETLTFLPNAPYATPAVTGTAIKVLDGIVYTAGFFETEDEFHLCVWEDTELHDFGAIDGGLRYVFIAPK